jgi:hypothetical protein
MSDYAAQEEQHFKQEVEQVQQWWKVLRFGCTKDVSGNNLTRTLTVS